MSYESHLNRHRARSPILGDGDDADQFYGGGIDLTSARGVRDLIAQYDRERTAEQDPGFTQNAQDAVQAVEREWSEHRRRCRAQGQPTPKRMPPETRERHDAARARLDVAKEERDRLGELLDGFISENRRDRRAGILRKLGSGTVKTEHDIETGLYRTTLDAQFVSLADANGHVLDQTFNPRDGNHVDQMPDGAGPIIHDRASPYRGMSLADYREHVAEPLKQYREQCKREWLEQNEALPKEQREVPSHIVGRAKRATPDRFPPRWPTGIEDWLDHASRQAQRDTPTDEQGNALEAEEAEDEQEA